MALTTRSEDSLLGAWSHLEFRPPAPNRFVDSVWLFDGMLRQRETFFPTGTLDLLLQLDPSARSFRVVRGQSAEPSDASTLTGLLVAPLTIETPAQSAPMLGVTLRPAGAVAMFGVPLNELTGASVSLDDLIGREAGELSDRLAGAGTNTARLRIMTRWVAVRLAAAAGEGKRAHGPVDEAVAWIERTRGAARIGDLVRRSGVSANRFIRQFEREVGVTPKSFARIVRFREVATSLASAERSLAEIADAHGYYDQAHMHAEVRALSGMTPGRLRAASLYPGSTGIVS